MKEGKIIIFSAPSGSGKSTIIHRLMADERLRLGFSVSATSRSPRAGEVDGKDYFFITAEEFDAAVRAGRFIEWEEVYNGTRYGTLSSEVERVIGEGRNLVLDIDVKGGVNVKRIYGDRALSVFIQPPSLEVLAARLRGRGTDSEEVVARRLAKAEEELSYAPQYDAVVVNDDLDEAVAQATRLILDFTA